MKKQNFGHRPLTGIKQLISYLRHKLQQLITNQIKEEGRWVPVCNFFAYFVIPITYFIFPGYFCILWMSSRFARLISWMFLIDYWHCNYLRCLWFDWLLQSVALVAIKSCNTWHWLFNVCRVLNCTNVKEAWNSCFYCVAYL